MVYGTLYGGGWRVPWGVSLGLGLWGLELWGCWTEGPGPLTSLDSLCNCHFTHSKLCNYEL